LPNPWVLTFPKGNQPFKRRAIHEQKQAGISQALFVPVLMRDQQPLQAAPIRQPGKARRLVSFKPAVKGTEVAAWRARTASQP